MSIFKSYSFPKIHFIDYEFSGLNIRAFEFGNLLNELIVNYELNMPPYFIVQEHQNLSEIQQRTFFAHYLISYLS